MSAETIGSEEISARLEGFAVKCDELQQASGVTPRMARALKGAAATFRRAAKKSPESDQPSISGSLSAANGTLLRAWQTHPEEDSMLESVGALLRELAEFRKEFNRRMRKPKTYRTGRPY